MPVKIQDGLPARKILESEGVHVISENEALRQDIRPLKVAIVNIMPRKDVTETHLLRLLSNSPLQIETPTFLHTATHTSKNTAQGHLQKFYKHFDSVQRKRFDCLIVTGAPVETIEFSRVEYWEELCKIMDWSVRNVYSTLHICWGAQAGLYHHWGVNKHPLKHKMFGVFEHTVVGTGTPLLQGFDDSFMAPHSRHTTVMKEEISAKPELSILAESKEAGVYLVSALGGRQLFITGHPEYDSHTLKEEYERDVARGLPIVIPKNYFSNNQPSQAPVASWRAHANLLFSNWLSSVYQKTPFNLRMLPPAR